jgi:FAD/FMN-containing dehydrogenase
MKYVTSWGRLGNYLHSIYALSDRNKVADIISCHQPGIAYGMGRSYGDACLNPHGILWQTTSLDHFISFDERSGRLVCEAGVLLRDIQRLTIPKGWCLPVTPGTQLITVGGAIANDVHGKNHHVCGSFGDHLLSMRIIRTTGEIIDCGPDKSSEWFAATVGGVGLTGVILFAELQLRPVQGSWLQSEIIPYTTVQEFFQLADASEADWEHTVSWIDCLSKGGRGLFMRANPCAENKFITPSKRKLRIPFALPVSLVNPWTLRPFNTLYYNLKKWRAGQAIVHYEEFFYPLDNLLEWNRMYGLKGFYQYQCLVPRPNGQEAIQAMLQEINRFGEGSFLAVLKTFGNRSSQGLIGFPAPGVTLALDFPNKGEETLRLFARLDEIVKKAGGRIYLAKDARMPREFFEESYPLLPKFLPFRDPGISSALSRRLMGY